MFTLIRKIININATTPIVEQCDGCDHIGPPQCQLLVVVGAVYLILDLKIKVIINQSVISH